MSPKSSSRMAALRFLTASVRYRTASVRYHTAFLRFLSRSSLPGSHKKSHDIVRNLNANAVARSPLRCPKNRKKNRMAKSRTKSYSNHSKCKLSFSWICYLQIAFLTYKTINSQQPSYLNSLLTPYIPVRNLRSFNLNLLVIPDLRSANGRRSFSYAAPTVWNSLPLSLRNCSSTDTFHVNLKTFLFPP